MPYNLTYQKINKGSSMYITDADALIATLPETRQVFYTGCNQLFFDMQVQGFVETVDSFVLSNNQHNTGFLIDEVTVIYHEYLINLLATHGVVIDDEQSPQPLTYLALLETLYLVGQSDEPQIIIETLESSDDNVIAVAMLLEAFHTQGAAVTFSNVLEVVDSVDDALIDRLWEIVEGKVEGISIVTDSAREMARVRYQESPLSKIDNNPIKAMLARGIDFGLPLETLWQHVDSDVEDLIASNDIKNLALLMYGCVIISNTADHILAETLAQFINSQLGDEILAQAIIVELKQTVYAGHL